jgi:hypothetical protein
MLGCVTMHEQPPGASGLVAPAAPSVLVTAVAGVAEADLALAGGADLIDITGLAGPAAAQLRAHLPAERLWTGSPAAIDADPDEADPGAAGSVAAAVATAAIGTWLGAPAIRSTHVIAVRRAIDMTLTIAGTRLPALTTRGLA